jgi:hypothetical protein
MGTCGDAPSFEGDEMHAATAFDVIGVRGFFNDSHLLVLLRNQEKLKINLTIILLIFAE